MCFMPPTPRRSTFGPRSRYFAGSHGSQTCAGSTTWSSTLMIFGIMAPRLYEPQFTMPYAGFTTVASRWQRTCGSAGRTRPSSTSSTGGSRPTPTASTSTSCGTKLTAAEVADTGRPAGRRRSPSSAWRPATGWRRSRELARGDAGLVGDRARPAPSPCPINTAYKGEYLRHQLADSGSRVLVVEAVARSTGRRAVAGDGRDARPRRGRSATPTPIGAVPRRTRWADLLGADPPRRRSVRPSDLATFVYTGGTTGPSKGCMLSHNYHEALARQIGICWRRTADDVVWTPLPLFHFNAIVTAVLGPLVYGGRAAIYRRFSVSNFWPEMNRTGATITSTLGTMAYLLAHDVDRPRCRGRARPRRTRRCGCIGAAPLPVEVDDDPAEPLRRRHVQRRLRGHRGVASSRGSRRASRTSPTPPA